MVRASFLHSERDMEMQFRLRSLFIAVSLIAVAAYLAVTASAKAAIVIIMLSAGTLFAVFGRKSFPRSAKWIAGITALFFLYFLSDGLLVALRPVVLRAAIKDDKVRDEYFCVQPMSGMTTRNVVVAEGTFSKDTWLTAVLYLVRAGSIQELNGFTVGRSPNRLGEAEWLGMRMTMALADANKRNGRITQLGVVGETRGSGSGGGDFVHNVPVVSKHVFPGTMKRGRMRIAYVEGDSEVTVTAEMSIEEFAKKNPGNYVVIVAGLEQ